MRGRNKKAGTELARATPDHPRLVTCACCGVTWQPNRSSPSVTHVMFGFARKKTDIADYHLRCYESMRAYAKRMVEKELASRRKKKPK